MKTTCWVPTGWAAFLAHEERFISSTSQLPELLAASSPYWVSFSLEDKRILRTKPNSTLKPGQLYEQ